MKPSDLRKRIREYEDAYRIALPKRTPVIIRVDGRAFHTLTKRFNKPWDHEFMRAMNHTAQMMCESIQSAQVAYVQSDEITIFIRNYDRYATSPWFSNGLQKVCSLSAGIATRAFNKYIYKCCLVSKALCAHWEGVEGEFDSRVFCVPREEVCNVFIDRQKDCQRNAVLSVGQHVFGKKKINGWSCSRIIQELDKLNSKYKIENIDQLYYLGRVLIKSGEPIGWRLLDLTPEFQKNREFIDKLVWPADEEGRYSIPLTGD